MPQIDPVVCVGSNPAGLVFSIVVKEVGIAISCAGDHACPEIDRGKGDFGSGNPEVAAKLQLISRRVCQRAYHLKEEWKTNRDTTFELRRWGRSRMF